MRSSARMMHEEGSREDHAPPATDEGQGLRRLIAGLRAFADGAAVIASGEEGGSVLTFAALADRVEAVTAGLAAGEGIAGRRAAILASNSPDWIVACLAIINAGGIAVPLDARLDEDSLRHVLTDCAPDLVFTSTGDRDRVEVARPDHGGLVCLDDADGLRRLMRDEEAPELTELDADGTAVIFYTSGTTGPPKGVPLSHRNLLFEIDALLEMDLMAPGERLLLPLPLHHVYPFVVGMLAPLACGAAVVLPQSMTGPHVMRAIRSCDVATILGVPRLYEAMADGLARRAEAAGWWAHTAYRAALGTCRFAHRGLGLRIGRLLFRPLRRRAGPKLRLLASGGAALGEDLAWTLDALGWTVATGYGLTETSPMLSVVPPGDRHFGTAGRPVPGVDLRIVPLPAEERDEEAEGPEAGALAGEVAEGSIGEIEARGPNIFRGYLNLPDRDAEAFSDDGWFRTEDRGWIDDDGYLHVAGRADTFVVTSGGENISLEELEQTYARLPQVAEIGIFQRDGGLAAVAVPDRSQRGAEAAEEAVREAIEGQARQLPPFQRITDLAIGSAALSRTRLGKIRRGKLREHFDALRAGTAREGEPTGPIPVEEMSGEDQALLENAPVQEVWSYLRERFEETPLTPDSAMAADLGIDSLEWMNLTLEIQERAGVSLSEQATGRIVTVRDLLGEVLESPGGADSSPSGSLDEPEKALSARQRRWLRPLGPVESAFGWLVYHTNRLVVRALFRVRVEGVESLRKVDRFVLTPNHVSYLDPFVLAAAVPYDILKRSAFTGWTGIAFANPLFRFVSRLARTLPVEHAGTAFSSLALALAMLRRRQSLIWFPEGARSGDGSLQQLKPGIALLLQKCPVPVVPAFIDGTFEALPRGRRLPRLRRVRVRLGQPIDPKALDLASADGATESLHRAMLELRRPRPESGR